MASIFHGRKVLPGVPLAMSLTSPIIVVSAGLWMSIGSLAVALSNVMNCGQLGPVSVSAWRSTWYDPGMRSGVTIGVFSRMH